MEQPSTNMFDSFKQAVSPFDAEAEPDDMEELYNTFEDMAAMEQNLSETTEDDTKLTGEEQDECCGWPPKDEDGCCDMPLEEYDPGMLEDNIEQMMEDLALAEPEPPEEDRDEQP